VYFQGTEFTDLTYPPLRVWVDKAIGVSNVSGNKIGDVLTLEMTSSLKIGPL